MKLNYLLSVLLTVSVLSSYAEEKVKVKYDAYVPSVNSETNVKKTSMTLISNGEKSLYFNETSLLVDSMTSTPEGKKALREMQMAAWMTQGADGRLTIDMTKGNVPKKTVCQYVEKNLGNNELTEYNKWMEEFGFYSEPLAIEWTIGDSTTTILDYECLMATAMVHGREWTAWFTPEIPVGDGPWKLFGLPGMILKAQSGRFGFNATEVGQTNVAVPSVYSTNEYEKIERTKALSNQEYYENNRMAVLNAKFGTVTSSTSSNTGNKKSGKFTKEKHAMEIDY
ncbi:MAG: GLPGLI family protein [Muribaculaceae bacterium]|nr:GLPGLI family protein [Muribaculaceae bacterium]